MISAGDVVQVVSGPKPSSSTADAIVLASKGGLECDRAAQVEIALADLQEMQNHMRETTIQSGNGAGTDTMQARNGYTGICRIGSAAGPQRGARNRPAAADRCGRPG